MGLSVGLAISSAFGLAAATPKLYVGFVGAGTGLAGLPPFALWMILAHGVFKGYANRDGVIKSIWIVLGFASFLSFSTLTFYLIISKSPRFSHYFEKIDSPSGKETFEESMELGKAETSAVATTGDLKTYERIGFRGIVWQTSVNLLWRFIIFYQTMLVFPTIGPLSWGVSPLVKDVCVVRHTIDMSTIRGLGYSRVRCVCVVHFVP